MSSTEWVALEEEGGKIFFLQLIDEMVKIKGLGVLNPIDTIGDSKVGDKIIIGQKILTKLNPRLPELYRGMKKSTNHFCQRCGRSNYKIGYQTRRYNIGSRIRSGGLSLHLVRVLGDSGFLITVEARDEHAEVG